MNRRGFLARLLPMAAAVPALASTDGAADAGPVAVPGLHCPVCADALLRVDRLVDNPVTSTFSCGRCQRSWAVDALRPPSREVPYVWR